MLDIPHPRDTLDSVFQHGNPLDVAGAAFIVATLMNSQVFTEMGRRQKIQGVRVIEYHTFQDERGAFEAIWEDHLPIFPGSHFSISSVNVSHNTLKHTLRGMHFQENPHGQAKVVACVNGSIFDVIVDLRPDSTTYKEWVSYEISAQSGKAIYIPKGCAHGFVTLTDNTIVSYLINGRYLPDFSRTFHWQDQEINVNWPTTDPILSERDRFAPPLAEL